MSQNEPRPPYVAFKTEAVEDRTKEVTEGVYAFKNVVFAHITVPGQRDTVVKEAQDWLKDVAKRAKDGLIPKDWFPHFKQLLQYYLEEREIPENGTPIRGWNLLTPAQQEGVVRAGIRTVEDLAVMTGEAEDRIGMGAASLKQKAQAWLMAGTDKGAVAAENAALKVQVASLEASYASLLADVQALKAGLKAEEKTF